MTRLRAELVLSCVITSVLSLSSLACTNQVLDLAGNQVEANLTANLPKELPDGLHVLVCGAGGPLPDEERTSACLVVIAGERVLLFDAGGGSARTMAMAGIQPGMIERVLLTHFHSDHFDGLGEVATLRWAGGSWPTPLAVHGPDGVEEIVEGLNLAYRQDQRYRTAHHGPVVTPPEAAGMTASPFAIPAAGRSLAVLEEGPLRVLAFAVDHAPVAPAIGYRVEYKDRSIAISGDTAKSPNLISQARGVDLLIHEALSRKIVGVMNAAAGRVGNSGMQKITADILDYHASPVEAAESAAEAEVEALLIYHVVPPLPIRPLEGIFRDGMDDAFEGEIEIAVDGTFVSLPAGSNAIEFEERL